VADYPRPSRDPPGSRDVRRREVRTVCDEVDRDPGTGHDDDGPTYFAEARATLRRPTSTAPRVEIQQAIGEVQNGLQLPDSPTVVSRHQQRYIDGIPFSLQTSLYPMGLVVAPVNSSGMAGRARL
jgi:hypothetical protein